MASHSFSTKPLYLQLRDALSERVATGQWQPGACIPNEHELAREFNVSTGTMRKALGIMEDEHLIARRQGRGTFVNDPGLRWAGQSLQQCLWERWQAADRPRRDHQPY